MNAVLVACVLLSGGCEATVQANKQVPGYLTAYAAQYAENPRAAKQILKNR